MINFTEFFIWVRVYSICLGDPVVGGVGVVTGAAMPQYEFIRNEEINKY